MSVAAFGTRPILLSGFMATGKTAVGQALARRLGRPFVDTDAVVESRAGMTIAALWAKEGENAFRSLERDVVREAAASSSPAVIAVGGGALMDKSVRHEVLERGWVVTLRAAPESIAHRVKGTEGRPLLAGPQPSLDRIRSLLAQRAEAYAECHFSLSTDDQSIDALTEVIESRWKAAAPTVLVPLGSRTYGIEFVHDAPGALTQTLAALDATSLVVVTDSHVQAARGGALHRALEPLALRQISVTLPPGEPNKTLATVATVWDAALGAGVDRRAVVLAFGGGVVGDLAGFAASTLLRGVRLVQVPTSLLAMVDSSAGGKTGFDYPAGKNLVGTFHQPAAVVVDTLHLSTLPPRELRAGLAEVVKAALVGDSALLATLEEVSRDCRAAVHGLGHGQDGRALGALVRASVDVKMRLVRDDERESGPRALLNLGHTVGHCLEAHGAYRRYLHGEAVALGTVAELRASERAGWTEPGTASRVVALLQSLDLPTEVPREELRAALRFLASDKKASGADLHLPVVAAPGVASVRRVPQADWQRFVLAE